ncbi:MAG: hypothetical protein AAFU85_12770 [Planctomycetota bacterium]
MKWKWLGRAMSAIPLLITFSVASPCHAQPSDVETVRVTAAKPPVPALRYRFWPSVSEATPINAMPMFTRACFMMEESPETVKELNDVYSSLGEGQWTPELKTRAEAIIGKRESVLTEMERATDCMNTTFDLNIRDEDLLGRISLLLPEVQKSRQLARLLIVRGHLETRRGDWDRFSRTVTTLFRLSEMAGHDNAFLVGRLVSFAIVSVTLELVETASQFEDCPNFYWALSCVPDELFDVQSALEWERENPLIIFGVDTLPDQPIGAEAAATQLRKTIETLRHTGSITGSGDDFEIGGARMFAGLYVAGAAQGCREILKSDPRWTDRVTELSDAEAVLRANRMECRKLVDEFFSWALLPTGIRDPYLSKAEKTLGDPITDSPVLPAKWTVQLLLPALRSVFVAERRMRNKYVEAINLQAIRSGCDGKALPDSIDPLPLPVWPAFGERPEVWYERVGASEANWIRDNEMKPGEFKQVKVVLQ